MITRYKAWIDNVALHELDNAIYITDIKEKTPKINAVTAAKPSGGGLHLLRLRRDSLSISIRFAIRAYDIATRKRIMTKVRRWAHEGYLTINDRPGQRLWVVCEKPPAVESALKWTAETEVTFTAYESPWWEGDTPSTASCSGTSGHAVLNNPGDSQSFLDASITPSAALTTLTVRANGQALDFTGLSISAGSKIEISHEHNGILTVKAGSTSLLAFRTAKSADDILLDVGKTTVNFTADADCNVTFSTWGRYE